MIAAWFAGTDHGLACTAADPAPGARRRPSRAGARRAAPAPRRRAVPDHPPRHEPGRGHYVFAMPPGRTIGNSKGRLGGGWGDIRGLNGIIVVAHRIPTGVRWMRTGPVPLLPDELAELLPRRLTGRRRRHRRRGARVHRRAPVQHRPRNADRPDLKALRKQFEAGESRHNVHGVGAGRGDERGPDRALHAAAGDRHDLAAVPRGRHPRTHLRAPGPGPHIEAAPTNSEASPRGRSDKRWAPTPTRSASACAADARTPARPLRPDR